MSELKNKNAFISGISKGIGRAIALRLASEGVNVFGCARNETNLQKFIDEVKIYKVSYEVYKVDVSDYKSVCKMVNEILARTKIDILVNNAGFGLFKKLDEISYEEFDKTIKVNLYGVYNLTKSFVNHFKENKSGDIIFVSSLAGKNPFAGGTAYCASKFALTGFAYSLMLELRDFNIRICLVHPGSVDTDMITLFNPNVNKDKILKAEDVAESVVNFLKLPNRAMISEFELRPTNPK